MRLTGWIGTLAACLFVPLFITRGIGWLDFWWWMSANVAVLLLLVAILDGEWRAELLSDFGARVGFKAGAGLLSALALYGAFYAGNAISRQLFESAGSRIADIYAFKAGVFPLRIAVLMVLVIGPGEELFWRGFLQRRLQTTWGAWGGFFAATATYTLVHIGSGNAILVLAAGLCGLFWGLLYLWKRSLLLNVISHTVWDVAIFLVFPVGG